MKRITAVIIIISVLLSGCGRTYDINERLIVQGVGIDYLSENEIRVTVQTLNTDTYSGIGGTKVPDELVKNYVLKGKSVASALSKLVSFSGKEPLYTHTRIILIGKRLAEKGLREVIDFFSRDSSCHASLYVAVCEGKAEDYFTKTEENASVPAVEIENAVGASEFGADSVNIRIYELIKMYREETTNAFLPFVSLSDNEGKNAVRVSGTAVFSSDRLTSVMDENDTLFLMLFLNRLKFGTYTLESFDGVASFNFYKSKCKTNVSVSSDGNCLFSVKIKCIFDCVEFSSENDTELDEKMQKQLEKMLESELSEKMSYFLYKMCRNGYDCMRLGRILLFKNSEEYRKKENDRRQFLSSADFDVKTDVTLRRIGQESGKSAL